MDYNGSSRTKAIWWALNIFLLLFVFLTFVLTAATISSAKKLKGDERHYFTQLNSSFVRIEKLTVAKNHHIKKGMVVSFTDVEGEVASGLGPVFQTPQYVTNTFSAAFVADQHSFQGTNNSIYVYATLQQPNNIQVSLINVPNFNGPVLKGFGNFALSSDLGDITYLQVKDLALNYFAIIVHTSANRTTNGTYILTGRTSPDYSQVFLSSSLITVGIDTAFLVSEPVVLISTGPTPTTWFAIFSGVSNGTACNAAYYLFDPNALNFLTYITVGGTFSISCLFPLRSTPLGNGYFVLGNQRTLALAQANFASRQVTPLAQVEWGIFYESLHFIHETTLNLLISVGIQLEGIQQPTPFTQVIQWQTTAPYLTVHRPTALLGTFIPRVFRNHIQGIFLPVDNFHPTGAIIFTFVDELLNLPLVIRGKLDTTYYRIISSPAIAVSRTSYFYRPPGFAPRPGEPGPREVYPPIIFNSFIGLAGIILQSHPEVALNTFYWHGGFKIAGISTVEGSPGQSVSIVRTGRAPSPYPLQNGFSYHANNTGDLHSVFALNDQFTSDGWPIRIGTAISTDELLLEFDVFERINNIY